MLLPTMASAQFCTTKSGTPISPAFRVAASPNAVDRKSQAYPDNTAGTYLVVTRQDLVDSLQEFLQWKREQGFSVELMITESGQRDSVRNALKQRYEASSPLRPAQRYVLIVGDVDRIQACQAKHTPNGLNQHATDMYFGEYSGDYVPEAWVGRLSVADSAELAAVARKIIDYEKGLWAASETALLTAGRESRNPAPTTTNGQVNYLAQMLAEYRPELETICFRNPAEGTPHDAYTAALNTNNAIVNYTAHCTRTGWSSPWLGSASLDSLEAMTPTVWVNNCCLSSAFNGNCFGEDLLRRPQGGAASVIGATNETLWAEDYYWAVGAKHPASLAPEYNEHLAGAFDQSIIGQQHASQDVSIGAINHAGLCAVTMAGSPYDAFYWEIYCILGDPSMTLFWGRHDTLPIAATDTLWQGNNVLHINTLPGTRISATTEGKLLATTIADTLGNATIILPSIPHANQIKLTATKPEFISTSKIVALAAPSAPCLALAHAAIHNDTLSAIIKNVGRSIASHHSAHLCQSSADRTWGATLPNTDNAIAVPSLAEGDSCTINFPLGDYTLGNEPILSARISFADSAGTNYASWPFTLEITDQRSQVLTLAWLETDGTAAQKIFHSHDYLIRFTLSHPADTATLWVNNQIAGSVIADSTLLLPYRTPTDLTHLHLHLDACRRGWHNHYDRWLTPYRATEDFESADFSQFPWKKSELYTWHIDSSLVHEGQYCMRSCTVDHAQQAVIELDIETIADDSVSFYYRVLSEAHDWLHFMIDGRRCGYWSGNQGWARYSRQLSAGKHRLQWIYVKDASRSELDDCARIDNIQLPLALWSQPCGNVIREEEPTTGTDMPNIEKTAFSASPNPAFQTITIQTEPSVRQRIIQVVDQLGRTVDEIKIEPNQLFTQYSTHKLRFGTFMLVLRDGANVQYIKIIVVQ